MTRLPTAFVILASVAGCTSSTGEDTAPTLEITSPQRGTFNDADTVTVSGVVHDDGAVKVTVNGQEVAAAKDGTFSATIAVERGVAILETHAIDATGHDVRDVRAVMAGSIETTDGSRVSPIGAQVGPAALRSIGNAMADTAENIDFTAAVMAMNPVYNNTGCLGARVDVTSITLTNIGVGLAPQTDVLSADVTIDNIVVKAHASYKAACIGGSTNITVKVSQARIHGDLGVGINGNTIATSLPTPSVALDGFTIDVGGVPSAVENLLKDKVRDAVANSLQNVIHDKVPGIANNALAGLVAKPISAAVLGHDTTVTVSPSQIELSSDGLFVAIDTTLLVAGGEGGMFVSTASPISASLMGSSGGLGIAVANDTVNQLFSGLWATGSLDQMLDITAVGPLAAILDDNIATLEVKLSLPPTVTTSGTLLTLAIGDAMIVGRDSSGVEVQRIALSLSATLAARPTQTGAIALVLGTPVVRAQVLAQSEVVDRPLTDTQVEGLVEGAWGLVSGFADEALAKLPLPAVAGIQLGAPTVSGREGFVIADIGL